MALIDDLLASGWTTLGLARALATDPSTIYRWRARGEHLDRVAHYALCWVQAHEKPEQWRGGRFASAIKTYLIQDGDTVKIGKSMDPEQRLRTLQVSSVRTLKLVAVLDAPEADVHAACRPFHIRGEWFRWCPELRRAVRAIEAAYHRNQKSGRDAAPSSP